MALVTQPLVRHGDGRGEIVVSVVYDDVTLEIKEVVPSDSRKTRSAKVELTRDANRTDVNLTRNGSLTAKSWVATRNKEGGIIFPFGITFRP